ncbi:hypothetical protein [Brucella sp. 09RB8471]|uniref:hypothetical protein n=1 Tax=Brucella sp. 09RB8471 TaxID=1149952 RepID=UPI0018DDFA74|nr:hypothetical protein [Brucella sp. 09RB8471]
MGWSPEWSNILGAPLREGEEFIVELRCECTLGLGFYEIQSYVSLERDKHFNAQRILSWKDEANFFSVTMPIREYFFGGICDMRMSAGTLERKPSVKSTSQEGAELNDYYIYYLLEFAIELIGIDGR